LDLDEPEQELPVSSVLASVLHRQATVSPEANHHLPASAMVECLRLTVLPLAWALVLRRHWR
jgi:hypothetical protein